MSMTEGERTVLFLQGPLSPLYQRLGKKLAACGYTILRVNLSVGDWLHWHGPECLSFRGRKEQWREYLLQLIEKHQITTLIMHGDGRWYHQQAVDLAHELGLEVIITELGLLRPGWLTLEWGGPAANSHFSADPERLLMAPEPDADVLPIEYRSSFTQMALWDASYNLLNYFLGFLYPHFTRHTPYHPLREYLAWLPRLLTEKRRTRVAVQIIESLQQTKVNYFVFPLQLSGDFQIRQHSPYESMGQAITEVLSSFAQYADSGTRLVLKQHPLDPGLDQLKQWAWQEAVRLKILDRVDYIDGGDLNQLLESALGIVTVNSTVGIEALQLLKPVKVLGTAIYDIPKLTYQGALHEFWREYHPPDKEYAEGLVRSLIQQNQVQGAIYGEVGLKMAVDNMVDKIENHM